MKYNTLEMIYTAIDDINLDLDEDNQLGKFPEAALFGPNSPLDSMGLVSLITNIEQIIEEKTGEYVPIADERAMSMESSPFQNVASLNSYIMQLLYER